MSEITVTSSEEVTERVDPAETAAFAVKKKFPGEILDDPRDRFTGLIVPTEKLVEISEYVRDELGFNYLSSLTGIDLIDDDKMEVVYHTYSINEAGGSLVLKVQVDRKDPVVPSLVPIWPGADFQEREAWDLFGIKFDGHPDLRRILMWEGFEGHPMRKDWKEPFYEDENKPFGSRWPGGNVTRSEEHNRYGKNGGIVQKISQNPCAFFNWGACHVRGAPACRVL